MITETRTDYFQWLLLSVSMAHSLRKNFQVKKILSLGGQPCLVLIVLLPKVALHLLKFQTSSGSCGILELVESNYMPLRSFNCHFSDFLPGNRSEYCFQRT